jgi:hypothetical protein
MRHYAGSIAFDAGERILGVSHPRGNLVTFWDAATGSLLWHTDVPDGCGIAPATRPAAFIVTGGAGDVLEVDVAARTRVSRAEFGAFFWDNHLIGRA